MEQTFLYVEDYIEFISGWRTRAGKRLTLFANIPSPLKLARYDVNILSSLGMQTALENRPYTDKQSELAIKIVQKYKKQLSSLDHPVIIPEQFDKFRLGVRQVDRTYSVYLSGGSIHLKFPFNANLISFLKEHARSSQGKIKWNSNLKVWELGITEYNINLVNNFSPDLNVHVSDEIVALYKKILETEKTPYAIELIKQDGKYTITNAQESLINFLEKRIGPDCWTDLIKLCDYSEVCGYTISAEVEEELISQCTDRLHQLLIPSRKYTVAVEELDDIIAYARLTDRLPIYYYDPAGSTLGDNKDVVYLNGNRALAGDTEIKLLVTTSNIMIGGRKQAWAQHSEKMIEII